MSSISFVNCIFSFLSFSFSSKISAGEIDGEEFEEITCSSPETDGDTIVFPVGTATVAFEDGAGDAETIFRR
jgi:hypothetical protein